MEIPEESIIIPMPSALTVKEPKTDHITMAKTIAATAISPIQPMGVVMLMAKSSFSGERILLSASLLNISLPF